MIICDREDCTACGACAFSCPKKCIEMREDALGTVYPEVDEHKCVSCGRCKKVCPSNNQISRNPNMASYAAWSLDEKVRSTSASGGIASEIYRSTIIGGGYCSGAKFNENHSVSFTLTNSLEEIEEFRNSKYVISNIYSVFAEIKEALRFEKDIVFIGLPCQVAALKNVFGKHPQLVLIDVVCHGVVNQRYLDQHIAFIEQKYQKKAKVLSFRDPEYQTFNFYLTCRDEHGSIFYAKRTMHGDRYQYGYHRMIAYRENCYRCKYASSERLSDITLSDYKGLGSMAPCSFDEKSVSSVIVHTEKGNHLLQDVIEQGRVFVEKRPTNEPIKGDPQLQYPSQKGTGRKVFEKVIRWTKGDFEKTMSCVIAVDQLVSKIRWGKGLLRKVKRKVIK